MGEAAADLGPDQRGAVPCGVACFEVGPRASWEQTLRREMDEEACATVVGARLLGFTRGECVAGPERGLVLVRSVWRADVELRPWEARFEIADRRVVAAAAVEDALSLGSHPF